MICTFIGRSDATQEIKPKIYNILTKLICENHVDTFYVGNHGNFDSFVLSTLRELKCLYPHIIYYIVLAYFPINNCFAQNCDDETIFPDGLECVPQRLAIIKRNEWMIQKSDVVVTFVNHVGNSQKFKEFAEKKNKTIIDIQ